jgi:hypothetical protein
MARKRPTHRRLALILTLLITLACDAAASLMPGGATPTPGAPVTGTPAPGETLPYPPPALLFREPAPQASQGLDAPLELVFDQPMDQQSVRDAFALSPAVAGELTWADARTARFVPAEPFQRGARYQVSVDKQARNAEGTALLEPITFRFQTIGFIEVSEVQPAPGSEEIDPETPVTIVFNRPIVPLAAIGDQAALPDPLTFDPPVAGRGAWLNTSIYRFHPDEGFDPATIYTARVEAGLEDTQGAVLENAYTWIFTTVSPKTLAFSPGSNEEHVAPGATISVTFNQPMDHAATAEAFTLYVNNRPVAGTFDWTGGAGPRDEETMIFTPLTPLPRNATGQAILTTAAHARESAVPLNKDLDWYFRMVMEPGVVSTSPNNIHPEIDTYEDVEITFASPMRTAVLLDYLTITPEPTEVYTYWYNADTELRLSFPKEPATDYQIRLREDAPDRYGAPLGETLVLRFTTRDLSPYAVLSTLGSIGAFNAYTETALYARYRNVSQLDLRLYRLPLATFMRLHGYGDYEYRDNFQPAPGTLVRQWSVPVEPARNTSELRRLPMVNADGAPLAPGIYYVELTAPEVGWELVSHEPFVYTFVRSATQLVLKQAQDASLVWATDLASGEPVANQTVRFYRDEGVQHGVGQTGADGIWQATDLIDIDLWDDYFAVMGEPGDETFAITYNEWDFGIRPWNFDLYSDYSADPFAGYLYTDRPIYRPGQTVYFKGIVRADDDATYTVPEAIQVLDVRIDDPQGKALYEEALSVSEMGTFFDELTLDEEAPLGTYFIQIQGEQWDFYASTSFRVAEYRKPAFEVTVATDQDAYLNQSGANGASGSASGDINVSVAASYYFGGSVSNAEMTWNVLSAPYSFEYDCPEGETCPRYSWTDYELEDDYGESYGGYGRLIADGETATGDDGRATFEVAADISEEIQSRRFTIEANVTDLNNQVVSQRTTAVVHQGAFYVGLAPERRVAQAGEEATIRVLTVDWESAPVTGETLEVVVMEHRWYSVREEADNGYAYWTWTTEDVPVYTTTVTTDDQGRATVPFTPETSGSYRVRATGEDDRGNRIRSSTYLWVWGGGPTVWRRESTNRIDLVTDRDGYAVGDVAEILIPSPYTGTVRALITIERGHILETDVRELTSSTEVLRIPIREAYVPNVFVSVVLVQGSAQAPDALASFKMGEVKLPVSTETKQLQITLTPDRDMAAGAYYRPRETAVYDVLVTDHAGNPVEAELSLRLADLAVLALADEQGPTLLERFWDERGLSVRTSTMLEVAMEAHNRELAPQAKGGGGGAGDESGFIRTRFADTAFWDAVVQTGADGRARVEVALPDNLTTWRMQARGITAETLVGRAEVDIRTTLDLLVRPLLPRFFVVNDEAEIATIVHNNTAEDVEAEVTLTIEGLSVDGATVQTIRVPAEGQVKVIWPVKVLPGERVAVQMEARSGDLYDGREDTLPVYRYTTPEVVATAGRLSEPELRQEVVQLPAAFDPTQGELAVQVDGSLTAATQDALAYLEHYAYECVEQTVSRFLPNVLTYQALAEMGFPRPELEENLRTQVAIGTQRLYNQQQIDGGWGWWAQDESSPYLTAYVLQGLLEAHRAGFTVETDVVHRAARYLREDLNERSVTANIDTWRANRLAYELMVLGEYVNLMEDAQPAGELARAVKLFDHRERLDHYGRATLAVALGLLEPEEAARVRTLLSDLAGDAVYSATGTHWEEDEPDYWNMNTDVRTTAIALWAMARHTPESELLPNVVRWLMAVRREGYWESTNTTAWALMGLISYMRASGELGGEFDYTVRLNGEVLLEGEVSAATIDERQSIRVAIAELLVDRGNRLIIERHTPADDQSGAGQLYYTAHLRYYLPVEQVEALDRGIIVARQYSPVGDPDATIDEVAVGESVRVKLILVAPTDLHYVVVEDPLPAGFEAVDVTLNTTSVVGERPSVRNLTAEEEDRWYRRYGWGWWWFSHSEIRDEKVALFATYLPRGTYEYSYVMRASVPGTYNVIPTTAYEMYFPEVFGRSDGGVFRVVE